MASAAESTIVSDGRTTLIGLPRAALGAILSDAGEKPFRERQLWHWIYHRGETDFRRMTALSKGLRDRLAERFVVDRPRVCREQRSTDGTRKWLLGFDGGGEVETVHIPEADRGALCMSSQVGCTLTCRFCHSGTQTLVRNLAAGEIVGQLMMARDALGEWPTPRDSRQISNVVMMGMGEPLFNFEAVATALRIIMDGDGIALSRRRITLSTAGVVPMMDRCGRELGVNLAVSLHAVRDSLRDELVPLNRRYPLQDLLAACRAYPGASNARRITFEYVMLDGVNDAAGDARELVRLVAGIPAKFNLIPFNPWPGAPYACSSAATMTRFQEILNDAGYSAPIRLPRGRDIMAACGQLRSLSERSPRPRAAREAAADRRADVT